MNSFLGSSFQPIRAYDDMDIDQPMTFQTAEDPSSSQPPDFMMAHVPRVAPLSPSTPPSPMELLPSLTMPMGYPHVAAPIPSTSFEYPVHPMNLEFAHAQDMIPPPSQYAPQPSYTEQFPPNLYPFYRPTVQQPHYRPPVQQPHYRFPVQQPHYHHHHYHHHPPVYHQPQPQPQQQRMDYYPFQENQGVQTVQTVLSGLTPQPSPPGPHLHQSAQASPHVQLAHSSVLPHAQDQGPDSSQPVGHTAYGVSDGNVQSSGQSGVYHSLCLCTPFLSFLSPVN